MGTDGQSAKSSGQHHRKHQFFTFPEAQHRPDQAQYGSHSPANPHHLQQRMEGSSQVHGGLIHTEVDIISVDEQQQELQDDGRSDPQQSPI